MDQPKYHIDIFWSDEDGGYIANVPALRYCSAFGESYEEALREVLVAMELHLDTLRELDHPIPEPADLAGPEAEDAVQQAFEDWSAALKESAETLTAATEAQREAQREAFEILWSRTKEAATRRAKG